MIKQIQVIVENEFLTPDRGNTDLNNTVFERAFRKLTREKSGIGKLFPIYLKIGNVYYTLGIFTLNRLGSTSLFLELPKGTFFDHITFGKNLIENNTHLTYVDEDTRKKVAPMKPGLLTNGTYHVLTLIIEDISILKITPKKIIYPPVNVEQFALLKEALFTGKDFNGSGILKAVGESGLVVVQIFLIPKGVNFNILNFTKAGLGQFAKKFDERKLKHIQSHQAHLGHEFQNEYQFGLLTFRYPTNRYPTKINGPLYLGFTVDRSGLYFNSPDQELNKSVINIAKHALKIPRKML